jgi:hypothetical protein
LPRTIQRSLRRLTTSMSSWLGVSRGSSDTTAGRLFVPIPVSAYVRRAQLKEQEGRFLRLVRSSLVPDNLPSAQGSCLAAAVASSSSTCAGSSRIRRSTPSAPTTGSRPALPRRRAADRLRARHALRRHGRLRRAVLVLYFFNFPLPVGYGAPRFSQRRLTQAPVRWRFR